MHAGVDILTVEGLYLVGRDNTPVLDRLSFCLRPGEKLAIIGPNGSGKSSLLQTIIQERRPDKGIIYLSGRALGALPSAERAAKISCLSQNDVPDLRLELEEYVALGLLPLPGKRSRRAEQKIVDEMIEETGLTAQRGRLMGHLSGGQRQRASLARALAQSPALLLLDEPTNHLDPQGRSALLALVKRKNIAVIAVLHDLTLAESFADRVLVLNKGRQIICDVPDIALHTKTIFPVFGMKSFSVSHPVSGKALRVFEVPGCA